MVCLQMRLSNWFKCSDINFRWRNFWIIFIINREKVWNKLLKVEKYSKKFKMRLLKLGQFPVVKK